MATITFRTDPEVDAALSALVGDGRDRSRAIREAIIEAARWARGGRARPGPGGRGWATRGGPRGGGAPRLRAEADALAADPADRAEARAVLEDLESLRAW